MGGSGLVFLHQVHGNDFHIIAAKERTLDPAAPVALEKADALITDAPGINLVIQVADCQAVLLVDPVLRVIANVHSGWRGSIGNIIGGTVAAMKDRFGCRPKNIQAGIGPSLGPCCAEFMHYKTEIPDKFWKYKDTGVLFDFWAISRDQLVDAGVPDKQIRSSGICTRCRTDLFFSYRKEGKTGRFAAVVGLI
jgi:polyphenol oxidase